MDPISEPELVMPTLYLLDQNENGLTTSDLRQALQEMFQPSGDDLTILPQRNDTKFSQKVRNLIAHNTLISPGLVTIGAGRNAAIQITAKGRERLQLYEETLEPLRDHALPDVGPIVRQVDKNKKLTVLDERIIREGDLKQRTSEYRERSVALRNAAIDKYSENGRLNCSACGFDFSKAYPGIGEGRIHIHHLRPVSFMSGEAMKLSEALENVRPLCANCHLIVHTKRPPMAIEELRAILAVTYVFAESA